MYSIGDILLSASIIAYLVFVLVKTNTGANSRLYLSSVNVRGGGNAGFRIVISLEKGIFRVMRG